MNNNNTKPLENEILSEEYSLGKEYYDKILKKAKEAEQEKYN